MSITKHVTFQKIVAHDFRYDPRSTKYDTSVAVACSMHKDTEPRDVTLLQVTADFRNCESE